MIDPAVAIEKLHSFETADEIAGFFKSEKIKAIPRNSFHCPISEWVSRVTETIVRTHRDGIQIMDGDSFNVVYEHTDATRLFMDRFDFLHYPDLMTDEERRIYISLKAEGLE